MVAAMVSGMVLATSVAPNLWLVGACAGGSYGLNVAKRQQALDEMDEEFDEDEEEEDRSLSKASQQLGVTGSLVLRMGRKLALLYLDIFDKVNIMFFMYKTGQLSYQVR